jgi:hypothetical protein
MLKNIRLHLDKDEQKQHEIDENFAKSILQIKNANLNSFTRNISSLLPILEASHLENHSLICNKFGEANIVDYGLGRTLYGFHPKAEVQQQVYFFEQHAPYISLDGKQKQYAELPESQNNKLLTESEGYQALKAFPSAPEEIECLVILGIGLGHHLSELIHSKSIKYLIVYEPEPQYFKCSSLAIEWDEIFNTAKTKGTQLFLQVGKDGRDLVSDINELKAHANISGFYLYKHYNHAVFNSLYSELIYKDWGYIEQQGISFKMTEDHNHYAPPWTPPISLNELKEPSLDSSLFERNLEALRQYFPAIYAEFKDYTPKNWLPAKMPNGDINIIKKDNLTPWYSINPKNDCYLNFDNYNEQPNKDGLILGYSGNKLAHYIHYQFVKETEELLKQAEEEIGSLPEKIASIIMFGVGVGYQIEKLLAEHTVEKLFLCEHNTDFFYGSLFAIDWMDIFEKIEQSDARIYLNIGDDGTNLFRDLLSQFYSIGPYILSNTYFYQSYYNASLNSAIAQLREQLQVVISMGEYFDHAYYGIEHTKEGMRRKIPVLTANPAKKLTYDDKEVPVFIVGNGPSLDSSIAAIKEWQGQSIVVSCGTTLQALHRHGITPDFHAEIEQNRSTFDWAVLIGDLDYLKKITLISCNGIHPDTCELYKDVLVAFKEGESSTVSALNILGRENFHVLHNAFPTVSNFACDLFSQLGFSTIYLIGVDLGFVSVKHHHSKSSGYYQEDGEETYDYAEKNNTSLVVAGNFRPTVNTKHEFKVSRQVIEQVTAHKPKNQSFYNCSDGARISGTLPIRPDDLLIVATQEQKQNVLEKLKTQIFSTDKLDGYIERFEKQFSRELLMEELQAFDELLSRDITTEADVEYIVNQQKEMLFNSYKKGQSLLFYYLYGTVNYANAVLTKLINVKEIANNLDASYSIAIEKWLNTIDTIKKILVAEKQQPFDVSASRAAHREKKFLELSYQGETVLVVTDSDKFWNAIQYSAKEYFPWLEKMKRITLKESLLYKQNTNFVIYYSNQKNETNHIDYVKGTCNTLAITPNMPTQSELESDVCILNAHNFPTDKVVVNELVYATVGLECCLSMHNSPLVFLKYYMCDSISEDEKIPDIPIQDYVISENTQYVCLYPRHSFSQNMLISGNGSRGRVSRKILKNKELIKSYISKNQVKQSNTNHATILNSLSN